MRDDIKDDTLEIFCEHLDLIHKDMLKRFEDLLSILIPDWVLNPFENIEDVGAIEEELIEVWSDVELKPKFNKSYQDFWLQAAIPRRFPALWELIEKLLIAFPTSYLVERGFSAVTRLLSKERNRLQIVQRGDLWLLLTNLEPEIDKLTAIRQAHTSH